MHDSLPSGQVEESFDPWGKPGAGAPLRNTKGQTVTTVYGKCYREQQGTSQSTSDVTTKVRGQKQPSPVRLFSLLT